MAEKRARLNLAGLSPEQVAAELNRYYGENTVVVARRAAGLRVDFFSTTCCRLDYGMGGGVAKNRIIQVHGPYSALKTTLAYKSIASFQRRHKKGIALLVDYEKSHDPKYCDLLGVDPNRLYIINPDSGEQGVDVLNDYMTVDFDLFAVVDSIAAIVPTAEIETTVDQQTMALQARLINKMMRILVARMKRNLYDPEAPSTTVWCNNQIRSSMQMYGDPEVTPGGKGKDFAYSVMVVLRSGSSRKLMRKESKNGYERLVRYGQKVEFKILKNKVSGSQFDEGDFEYYIRPTDGYPRFSFNNADALLEYGLYYGNIKVSNSLKHKGKKLLSFGDIAPCLEKRFVTALIEDEETAADLHRANLDSIVEENNGVEEEEDEAPVKKKKKKILIRR